MILKLAGKSFMYAWELLLDIAGDMCLEELEYQLNNYEKGLTRVDK